MTVIILYEYPIFIASNICQMPVFVLLGNTTTSVVNTNGISENKVVFYIVLLYNDMEMMFSVHSVDPLQNNRDNNSDHSGVSLSNKPGQD